MGAGQKGLCSRAAIAPPRLHSHTHTHTHTRARARARAHAPGPSTCFLLSAVLRGGKRQFGGKIAYAGAIRNRRAVLCCHGALARHLVTHYTLGGVDLPDPADRDVWLHTPLWAGSDPRRSISYTQHAEALKYYLAVAGVLIVKVWAAEGRDVCAPQPNSKLCKNICRLRLLAPTPPSNRPPTP
jgi:hypothetical protein